MGPRLQGVKSKPLLSEIVEQSLTQAALWDEVKDRLHTHALGMSGGQQQRLCIARSLPSNLKFYLWMSLHLHSI